MAELGGINFPIRTDYDGSGVQNFIADLAFARSAFRQFRDDLASGTGPGRDFAAVERTIADNATRTKLALTAQVAALKAVTAAANQAAAAQKAVAAPVAAGATAPAAALAANTKAAAGNLREATVQASLLNSTIVRMLVFRQIVQFIREGVGLFKEFVKTGVEYDATIEKTRLSIAGLLDSIALIKDAQGNTLEGAQKFQASQAEAVRLTRDLNSEALRTGIAVQELGKTFAVALGPGLQAGLSLDNITKLTGEIAIAASTLNVSENRIAHELRDLTTGHIRSATDRIATSLGITNEDIKRAKEAGNLFDFLQKKLQGFNAVANEAPKTFDGLVDRLRVTSQIISGLAASNLFNELKSAGAELLKTLQGPNNPRIVSILQIIFDSLTALVQQGRAFIESLTFDDLEKGAKGVAAAINTLADIIIGVGSALKDVVGFVLDITSGFGGTHESVREVVKDVTEFYLALKIASPIASALGPAFGVLLEKLVSSKAAMEGLVAVVRTFGSVLATITGPVLLIVGGVEGLAALFGGGTLSVKEFAIAAEFGFKRTILQIDNLIEKFKGYIAITKAGEDSSFLNIRTNNARIEQLNREETAAFVKLIDTGAVQGSQEATQKIIEKAQEASGAYLKSLGENIRPGVAGIFDNITRGILDSQTKLITALGGNASRPLLTPEATSISVEKNQLTAQQEEQIAKQKEELTVLQAQASAVREITAAKRIGISVTDQQIIATRNQSKELEAQIGVQKAQNAIELQKLQDKLATDNVDPAAQQEAINALTDEQNGKLDLQAAKLEAINALLTEEENRAGKNGVGAAFDQMAVDITTKIPTAIEAAVTLAGQAVTQFASFVSDAIIAAFDPNNKESLLDRFKAFLSSILKQVIQMLVQIAITKAILGDPASNGGKAGGLVGIIAGIAGAVASSAQGGVIRSPQHYQRGAGSYAEGGGVRPNWVDRRDTVAAWLQPGEFVHSLRAVRKYGLAVMDSLNRGTANPSAVQAAVGIGSLGATEAAPRGASLAGGGVAAGVAGAQAHTTNTPIPAFIVADDHSVDALLRGGKGAVLRFMRENADHIDTAIRRARPSR
jgi:hypothetical protein